MREKLYIINLEELVVGDRSLDIVIGLEGFFIDLSVDFNKDNGRKLLKEGFFFFWECVYKFWFYRFFNGRLRRGFR